MKVKSGAVVAFFACTSGCTGCCPGGTYTIEASKFPNYYSKVYSTIGDLWREFKFDNPEGKPFSEIAMSNYDYYGVNPFDVKAYPKEMEAEAIKDSRLYDAIDRNRFYPGELFIFEPHAKTPCHLLKKDGCKGHESVVKNIVCAHEPEGFLHYVKGLNPEDHRNKPPLVPCVWKVNLDPADYGRVEELEKIGSMEHSLSRDIFPIVQLPGKSRWKEYLPLERVRDGIREDVGDRLRTTLESFDDPANRLWEGKIIETTKRYADAMGFKLAGL